MPTNVLIAGGGPAALEAALTLHRLAGERVVTTLLAPESNLTYRPLSVLSPFDAGVAPVYPLEQMAADAGFTHVHGRLAAVDATARTVTTVVGEHVPYDVLLGPWARARSSRSREPPGSPLARRPAAAARDRASRRRRSAVFDTRRRVARRDAASLFGILAVCGERAKS